MAMDVEQWLTEYEILRAMIQDDRSGFGGVELGVLHREIQGIWEAFKDNAPPDFGSLYVEFLAEYEKLKDFLLYQPLNNKTIVALGGAFSCGKSSFLNSLMARCSGSDWPILPEDIDPSTSVPTYLVHGRGDPQLLGVNIFDCRFEMPPPAIRLISHGFGAIQEDEEGVTLGHIVRNLFLSVPFQPYEHIAFLDTPGYSAPDDAHYSAKTDEQIARQQLNTANYILWFVQADAGTVTEKDVAFLQSLRRDIPKLVLVSKADRKTPEDMERILQTVTDTLQMKNIPVEGVIPFSSQAPERCRWEALEGWLEQVNTPRTEHQFAHNFKRLFVRLRAFYEGRQEQERGRLEVLNRVSTLEQDDHTAALLEDLLREIRQNMDDLRAREGELRRIQAGFFRELKTVGSQIGVDMPEPDEIALLDEKRQDLLGVLICCMEKKGLRPDRQLRAVLTQTLSAPQMVLNQNIGGLAYQSQLAELLGTLLPREKEGAAGGGA